MSSKVENEEVKRWKVMDGQLAWTNRQIDNKQQECYKAYLSF